MSYRLGIKGSPACAEEIIIDRDIRLAHATGAHIHIQHVSSKLGMETIRWWKATRRCEGHRRGLAAPPDLHRRGHRRLRHPLQDEPAAAHQGGQRGAAARRSSTASSISSPPTTRRTRRSRKSQDFVSAPNGITGLETALVSLLHHFIATGKFGWDLLVKRYSAEPRRLMGLDAGAVEEGQPADLILFDPEAETTFTADFMKSKSREHAVPRQDAQGARRPGGARDEVLLER